MGLLNYLFSDAKDKARQVIQSPARRKELLDEYLRSYDGKSVLSKEFGYARIGWILLHLRELKPVLEELRKLINEEFVTIKDEEKSEEQILDDLEQLMRRGDGKDLRSRLVDAVQEGMLLYESIHAVLSKLFYILKTELHASTYLIAKIDEMADTMERLLETGRIKEEMFFEFHKAANVERFKQLLGADAIPILAFRTTILDLFGLIYHEEPSCNGALQRSFAGEHKFSREIMGLAERFILEQEIRDLMKKEESKFYQKLKKTMERLDEPRERQNVATRIVNALVDRINSELSKITDERDALAEEISGLIDSTIQNEDVVREIIDKECPTFAPRQKELVLLAYHKSFENVAEAIDREMEDELGRSV